MEELRVMRNLRRSPNGSMYIKPCVPYVLTSVKKRQFLQVVGNLRMLTRFSANFSKHFHCDGLMELKSHDLHCTIQTYKTGVLVHPIAFVSAHNSHKTSEVFHATNVQRSWTLQRYLRYVFFLLRRSVCVLEIFMTPYFFDLVEHMLINLVG